MAAEVNLTFDVDKVLTTVRERRDELIPAVVNATKRTQKVYLGSIRDSIGTKTRIPFLLKSWRDFPVEVTRAGVSGVVGSDNKLARLRELGHPGITPGKNAVRSGPRRGQPTKALAIPLPAARTDQSEFARGGAPFQFDGLDFVPIKNGKTTRGIKGSDKVGLLVKGDEAFFLLAKKVKTRPFKDAANAVENNRDKVKRIFADEILRAISGSN